MKNAMYVFIFLAGFFLVTTPITTAVQCTINKEGNIDHYEKVENVNIDKLKVNIINRLSEYKDKEFSYVKITSIKIEDPDGPLEGGLDELSDWISLFFGLIELNACISEIFELFNDPTFLNIWMAGLFTWATYIYLGEAFDTLEFFKDER